MKRTLGSQFQWMGVAVFLAGTLLAGHALAYAPESDLLKIKGYSPETVDIAATQRNRQEWREPPAPKLTPVGRFFHNIYYGNWTGSMDEFGSSVIRE